MRLACIFTLTTRGRRRSVPGTMQGDSLQDTTQIVAHEIVEGISAELGAGVIADDCVSTVGLVNGVMVQGDKSREDGTAASSRVSSLSSCISRPGRLATR
jgi:hypothetical protein